MKYRKEIDGLRALAVMSVIFFHVGFTPFSGGFVGVDIFFVVSGYLISNILLTELMDSKFSLIEFYERRARRILPALFFMMLCSLPFAWFLMLPNGLKDYAKSLIAVPLFVSNILFHSTSRYFDIESELKPLLHTWSLGVEEQFYILFPIFLIIAWKLCRRLIAPIIFLITLASLMAAQWASKTHPIFAFYELPTRGFEILIGALIAVYAPRKLTPILDSRLSKQFFSLIGLMLILYSVFIFDKKTPTPSLYTLIPVLGCSLIIIFANNSNLVGKLLSAKFLVLIGLMSYSAYLWHQPIISFSKINSLFGYAPLNPFLIVVLTLTTGYLSWRFIEKPFRDKEAISSKLVLYFSIFGIVFFVLLGCLAYKQDGFRSLEGRIPPNLTWLSWGDRFESKGDICAPVPQKQTGISMCNFGDLSSTREIVLYGDSHLQAISEELTKLFIELNIKGVKITVDGCDVVPSMRHYIGVSTDLSDACEIGFNNMLSYIKNNNAEVIVSSRWTFKLYPIKGFVEDMPSKNSEGGTENDTEYREYVSILNGQISFGFNEKKLALDKFINKLLSSTNRLYLIYPIPEISWDIARKNTAYYRENGTILKEISIPYSDFIKRNQFIESIFNQYLTSPNFKAIKPEDVLCNTFIGGRCVAQFDTVPYYYDDDHLSDAGANLVVNLIRVELSSSLGGLRKTSQQLH
jgi:peptidoglycan/LPS O-acetylase OafA/YrhL